MAGIDRGAVATHLRATAAWLRFRGEKGFRARAYDNGADAIEAVARFEELVDDKKLTTVRGIGGALAAQIDELVSTGTTKHLDELRGDLPIGLPLLAEQAKLSPKVVTTLFQKFGIASYEALVAAARAGQLSGMRGLGPKTEARFIEGGRPEPTNATGRVTLDEAMQLATDVSAVLRNLDPEVNIAIAGEFRRALETVAAVELVVGSERPLALLEAILAWAGPGESTRRNEDTVEVTLPRGLQVIVHAVQRARFAQALLEATGPTHHVVQVMELQLGNAQGGADHQSEEAIYASAGLPFIPPELRDSIAVIETALEGKRFDDLVVRADVRGMVHCHTLYSDGRNSVLEMARAAEALGFSYITITDHSPTAHYAGGLDLERLEAQWAEIDEVQSQVNIRLLRGTESDITREGALDYPDRILEKLDVVIASIHNRYRLDSQGMTERVVSAMRHPIFKIWGHALGRILLSRDPIACDVERIFDVIAESRAAIEINGDPKRLDLPPALIPAARKRGIRFVLSSDAHSTNGLLAIDYAVAMARRGGLTAADILNTGSVDDFIAAVRPQS